MLDLLINDKQFYNYQFRKVFGRNINWSQPKTFNEKIQWRKLYQKNPLFSICSDKYRVREFVKDNSSCELIKLFGVFEKWNDIDFEALDKSFVIKTNHDSGGVVIVKDKLNENFDFAKKKIERSLKRDFGKLSRERHYSQIKPLIIIEELICDTNGDLPKDIKIHCFNGTPKFIQIANSEHTENNIFDLDWNELPIDYLNVRSLTDISRPKQLEKLLKCARELSSSFDYVRVDLYEIGDIVYFGELTFTPNNGLAKIKPETYDKILGDYWTLNQNGNINR